MNNRLLSFLLFFVLFIPSAFATARFERTIDVTSIPNERPAFVVIPEGITLYHKLSSLRITKDGLIIPHKTFPTQKEQLKGVIATTTLCSVEGAGQVSALHDGDTSTVVRPNPLENPRNCTMKITFSLPVRVDSITLSSDLNFEKLKVLAQKNDGSFVELREAKKTTSTSFSSVITEGLQIEMNYDTVPTFKELTLTGEIPARLLFTADPSATFTLIYGDDRPPAIPETPETLFATLITPLVSLGAEQIRDIDADGDGLPAANDNCPFVSNPQQEDSDSDGVGDACDNAPSVANAPQHDRDYDGIGDSFDNCPSIFNPDQRDDDLNGIGYVCDDSDGDGIINSKDNCPGLANSNQEDTDGNGIGNACELDRDSDGIPDTEDNCRGMHNPGQEDRDSDGIGDVCDSCPNVKNANQTDQNENGIGDACEDAIQDPDGDGKNNDVDNCLTIANPDQRDTDKDGIGDLCDNCPTLQNPSQKDSDKNGQGDVCTDEDGDGFLPHIDNCPTVANADQADKDNDGIGDACEDDDGDGIMNATDNCKYKSNRNQNDEDADGIGDVCDDVDNRFSEQYPWVMWIGMSFIVIVLLTLVVLMMMRIKKDQDAEAAKNKGAPSVPPTQSP